MNTAQQIDALLEELTAGLKSSPRRADWLRRARQLELRSREDILHLTDALTGWNARLTGPAESSRRSNDDAALAPLLEGLWRTVTRPIDSAAGASPSSANIPWDAEVTDRVERLYRALGQRSVVRHHLLRALSAHDDPVPLARFVELIVDDPPAQVEHVDLAFVPLFQRRGYPTDVLFPRLLDAIEHASVAAVALDLANYLTRRRDLSRHPATDRAGALTSLLAGLIGRLSAIEQRPISPTSEVRDTAELVNQSVALMVSLCDTLALVQATEARDVLHAALGVRHRRARTEAAMALARLEDERGLDTLVELAADPVARTRALAYLEELDQAHRVAEDLRSPAARAEGELADWLALPEHFGLPPQNVSVIDRCRQYWPSFEEPVDCFLLRFEYQLPQATLSGIGLVGPAVHAFGADLADLPPADIYAAFAGWQAEHPDIRETPADRLTDDEREQCRPAIEHLSRSGFQDMALVKIAQFFDQLHLVFQGQRAVGNTPQPGVAVVEGRQIHWYPIGAGPRPLGPEEVYYIHKGRQLLRTFNPPAARDGDDESPPTSSPDDPT